MNMGEERFREAWCDVCVRAWPELDVYPSVCPKDRTILVLDFLRYGRVVRGMTLELDKAVELADFQLRDNAWSYPHWAHNEVHATCDDDECDEHDDVLLSAVAIDRAGNVRRVYPREEDVRLEGL